jgi:hypothetical protein
MKYTLSRKFPHTSMLLLVAALLLLTNHPPLTSEAAAGVTRAPQGGVSFTGFQVVPAECLGGPQSIRATFQNTSGNPISVSLVVYRVTQPRQSPTFLSSQSLHRSATGVVPANGQITLEVELPCCAYQADAVLGTTILETLSDSGPNYGDNFLGASVNLRDGTFCTGDNAQGTCATCPPTGESEGCTPGYWKNHTESWAGTGYSPNQTTGSVFSGASAFPSLASKTLLQSLQGGGGSGTTGAAKILLRAAVAAVLNAAHSGVNYPRTEAQIITAVNAALTSNNRDTMLSLASALDDDNNLGCPLN